MKGVEYISSWLPLSISVCCCCWINAIHLVFSWTLCIIIQRYTLFKSSCSPTYNNYILTNRIVVLNLIIIIIFVVEPLTVLHKVYQWRMFKLLLIILIWMKSTNAMHYRHYMLQWMYTIFASALKHHQEVLGSSTRAGLQSTASSKRAEPDVCFSGGVCPWQPSPLLGQDHRGCGGSAAHGFSLQPQRRPQSR